MEELDSREEITKFCVQNISLNTVQFLIKKPLMGKFNLVVAIFSNIGGYINMCILVLPKAFIHLYSYILNRNRDPVIS